MKRGGQHQVPAVNGIFNAWVLVRPAEDLPGVWTAHALEFDVVSQGDSAEHALNSIIEAVCMVLKDDVAEGRDPYSRRAPAEYWAQLEFLLEHGTPFPVQELMERARNTSECVLAIQMFFMPKRMTEDARPSVRTPLAVRATQESVHA